MDTLYIFQLSLYLGQVLENCFKASCITIVIEVTLVVNPEQQILEVVTIVEHNNC